MATKTTSFTTSLKLGAIRGIEIHADASLLIIFALILFALGAGVFPAWHPDWGAGITWLTALGAALLFFVSLLLHELSHALVGRTQGMRIPRITLFVFGGMAHLEQEPHAWRAELLMAIVGPLVSFVIGFAALYLGGLGLQGERFDPENPLALLEPAGPLVTMALWLGPINILLALFNLVPGFPLDGGRVLRALIWWATGDLVKATRWAAGMGQGFGWLLIGCGVMMALGLRVPFFGSGLAGGLWIALIGWFLSRAALQSYSQLLATRSLEHVPVSRLMLAPVNTVAPDTTVEALLDEHVMRTDQRAFPVMEGSRLAGLVSLKEVRAVPRQERPARTVGEIMQPARDLETIAPGAGGAEALHRLSQRALDQLPVIENGELRGLIRREDILKWLRFHGEGPAAA